MIVKIKFIVCNDKNTFGKYNVFYCGLFKGSFFIESVLILARWKIMKFDFDIFKVIFC